MGHDASRRVTFTGPVAGLAGVTDFGFDVFRHAGSLGSHKHEGYEIAYLVSGQVVWQVDGNEFEVRGGDLFVARPGEEHSGTADVMHPCVLFWTVILPSAPGLMMDGDEAGFLKDAFDAGARVARAPDGLERTLESLLNELRSGESPAATRSLLTYAIVLMGRGFKAGGTPDHEAVPAEVARALEIVRNELRDPPAVPELAERVGFSVSRLSRLFRKHVGLSPGDYIVRKRIDAAKELIREGAGTITDVAFEMGFATSQHFADSFRKVTGLTPTEWRRRYSG
ncbi:MAG: helix-turn-helix transcriptional regulator [Planctomycetes bacterium]|nr:helix-turn-helix transcriptional regulator [Planctomycetota bacterium]